MTQNNVIPFPVRRIESSQPEAGVFNIQNYLPGGKQTQLIEVSKGTHQIPHKIFEFMIKVTESRAEMAVFACLMRYTLGFHRSTCEASHSFIAQWTGLPLSSVRRGLESLLKARLIVTTEEGVSFKESTVYQVPLIRDYLEKPDSKQAQYSAQNEQSSVQSEHSTMPKLSTKKENTNITKEITTLTPHALPEYLKNYLSTLKPEQKRKREQKHFETLKNDYNVEDIAEAVKLLIEEGVPGTGDKCHSPFGFLACSMESVLSLINSRRDKSQKKEMKGQVEAEAEKKLLEAQKEREENARIEANRTLFEKTFPTAEQQESIFSSFSSRYPFFKKGSYALKASAINEWASTHKV